MTFEDITGNDLLIQRLSNSINGKGITHAYIFEGDYHTDKLAFAKAFVKAILCVERKGAGCESCVSCRKIEHDNHEDVYMTEVTDKGNTKDEEIYSLQERISKKPLFGDRNIAIIKDADSMTTKAQNRLLKTLEEPFPGTVIILLSNNVENLAQTILSRCVTFRINEFTPDDADTSVNIENEIIEMLLEKAPFYKIKEKLGQTLKDRNLALELLDGMQVQYRSILITENENSRLYKKADIYKIFGFIEEARRDIQAGVNTAYSLKNMILKIGG